MVSSAEGDSGKEVQDLMNRINEAWLGGVKGGRLRRKAREGVKKSRCSGGL